MSTIPIVFTFVIDPIGAGSAASFPRPVSNITGLAVYEPTVVGKWMELKQLRAESYLAATAKSLGYLLRSNRVHRSLNERFDLLDLFWFQLAGEIGHADFCVRAFEYKLL